MTTETERPIFRGVVCLYCKEPIPVPAIVGSLEESTGVETETFQPKSQVFNIRCPSCHKEKPYRTREIVAFEGTFEQAKLPVGLGALRWNLQPGIARSAKA
jgi:hypothetical protein